MALLPLAFTVVVAGLVLYLAVAIRHNAATRLLGALAYWVIHYFTLSRSAGNQARTPPARTRPNTRKHDC